MNPWLQLIGSASVATVLVAIINAIASKRKADAESSQLSAGATKIITDAASGVVSEIKADNDRLRKENVDLRRSERMLEARVDDLEEDALEWKRERDEWRRVLMVHGAWDSLAIAAVREAIPPITLPDVPPLTPPVSARTNLPRVPLTEPDPGDTVGP